VLYPLSYGAIRMLLGPNDGAKPPSSRLQPAPTTALLACSLATKKRRGSWPPPGRPQRSARAAALPRKGVLNSPCSTYNIGERPSFFATKRT
jgi:hypothetical protein